MANISDIAQYDTSFGDMYKRAYGLPFTDGVYRNSEIFNIFGEPQAPPVGDKSVRLQVATGSNSSVEIFTEGQAQPDADSQDYISGSLAYVYFRGMLQITGHLQDVVRNGGSWENLPQLEMLKLVEDIRDLMSTTFLGATNSGLEVMVDAGTSYFGITRGSQPAWESLETAISADLSFDAMLNMFTSLVDAERGARPQEILMSWTQAKKYYKIAGQPAQKNIGDGDAAPSYGDMTFNGRPIRPIDEMTNSISIFRDTRPGKWAFYKYRDMGVKEMAPSGDSDVLQISTAALPVCLDPKKQGKLTGLST